MIEPLIWNPLPRAAEWLAQKTGRPMDAMTLVDTVIKMGRMGDSAPTIIKMLLPKNTKCASLSIANEPALLPESGTEKFTRDRLEKLYGPLPNGITYLSESFPDVANLCVNHLIELLVHGEVAISLLTNKSQADGGAVWLMPWGTEHTATMETCGINRADLLALGDKLTAPAQDTATPAPDETKEQRQSRRLSECEDEGLNFKDYKGRLPDGVGKIAVERMKITRTALSKDLKEALERREIAKKEGVRVHRA